MDDVSAKLFHLTKKDNLKKGFTAASGIKNEISQQGRKELTLMAVIAAEGLEVCDYLVFSL